jgi:hypothetical protein
MPVAYGLMSSFFRLIPGSKALELHRHFRDLARLSEADVAFVSFPKSGRTFVRAMLARLYQEQFGIDERELLMFRTLRKAAADVPQIIFTHGPDAMRRPHQIHIDERAYRGLRLVLLVRHPGDVVVSRYHHLKNRSRDAARRRLAEQPLDEFVWTERGGVPSIVAFMNAWGMLARTHDRICILRYEDFLIEPAVQLRRLTDFIGLRAGSSAVENAVAFAQIENLRSKEREGYFSSRRLQSRTETNPGSAKVRSGKSGGFREALKPGNAARLDSYVEQELDPLFGYLKNGRLARLGSGEQHHSSVLTSTDSPISRNRKKGAQAATSGG